MKFVQKTLPGFTAMLSSPTEIEQFWIRKFVPAGSMPSVFGELPGALMVTPKTVTFVFGELNARWNCGALRSVSAVMSTLVPRVNWIRRGREVIVPAASAAHHAAPSPSMMPLPLNSTFVELLETVMKCAGDVRLFG